MAYSQLKRLIIDSLELPCEERKLKHKLIWPLAITGNYIYRCAGLIVMGFICYYSDIATRAAERRRRRRQAAEVEIACLESIAPQAPPSERLRSLTPPLPESSSWTLQPGDGSFSPSEALQRTSGQEDSMLFSKIPVEIRLKIYSYALGGSTLHIADGHQRFGFVPCRARGWHSTQPCYKSPRAQKRHFALDVSDDLNKHKNQAGLLSLLKTCRLVYSEAKDALYRDNVFMFSSVAMFREFSMTLRASHLDLIQSMSICSTIMPYLKSDRGTLDSLVYGSALSDFAYDGHTEYPLTWLSISKMRSLRYLYVKFAAVAAHYYALEDHVDFQNYLLVPLKHVRQCNVFEVEVNWPFPEHDEIGGDNANNYLTKWDLPGDPPYTFTRNVGFATPQDPG